MITWVTQEIPLIFNHLGLNYIFSKEIFSELFVVPGRDVVHAFETKRDHKIKETSRSILYTARLYYLFISPGLKYDGIINAC